MLALLDVVFVAFNELVPLIRVLASRWLALLRYAQVMILMIPSWPPDGLPLPFHSPLPAFRALPEPLRIAS